MVFIVFNLVRYTLIILTMLGRKELERSFSRKNGDFTSITKSLIKDMIEDKGLTSLELQSYFMNLEWYMQVLNGQNYRIDIYPDNLDLAMSDLFDSSSVVSNHKGLKEIRQKQAVDTEHS